MPLLFTPQPFYTSSLRDQYSRRPSYGYGYGYPSYEDPQEARARENYRREVIRQAELERYREQQLELERQRRAQRYFAQLERQRYLNTLRRRSGFNWSAEEPEYGSDEMEEGEISSSPFASVQVTQSPPKPSATPIVPPWTKPTLQKKHEAASLIQSTFRTYLTRRSALRSLSAIRSSFNTLKASFIFPTQPSFEAATQSCKLSYNSTNAPIHAYEDSLTKLLSKLDGVESNGDAIIRKERKGLATDIEKELAKLDEKKEAAWEAHRVEEQLEDQHDIKEIPTILMEEESALPASNEGETVVVDNEQEMAEVAELLEAQPIAQETPEVPEQSIDTSASQDVVMNGDSVPFAAASDDEDDYVSLSSLFSTPNHIPEPTLTTEAEAKEAEDFVLVDSTLSEPPSEPQQSDDTL